MRISTGAPIARRSASSSSTSRSSRSSASARPAPLAEVAREIRSALRDQARSLSDDRALRAVYEAGRDTLKTTGYLVRYALVDTSLVQPGEPRPADLDRFYRAHLADYSTFDR